MGYYEKRGRNSYRICTMIKNPDGHWEPHRETIHTDPNLPEDVQILEVKKELAMMEARLAAQTAEVYSLNKWAEEWLTVHLEPNCSPVTVSNYRHLLDSRILPQLGKLPLCELSPALLTDWLFRLRSDPRKSTRLPDDQLSRPRHPSDKLASPSKQKKPLSAKTLLHYYECMSSMLAAAVRMGYIEHNPMDRVQRPRQKKKKPVILSEEGALQLIAALKQEPACYRLAVLLALICGLRLGEVTALRFSDVDFIAGTINIIRALKYTSDDGAFLDDPKTESASRLITLSPSMARILQDAYDLDAYEIECAEYFHQPVTVTAPDYIVHSRNFSRLNKDTPSKWFRRFADAHGFPGLRFHDLRHAHASILISHNVDVATVASRMGHSSPSITLNIYTHAFRHRDQEAAAALDPLLAPLIPQDPETATR